MERSIHRSDGRVEWRKRVGMIAELFHELNHRYINQLSHSTTYNHDNTRVNERFETNESVHIPSHKTHTPQTPSLNTQSNHRERRQTQRLKCLTNAQLTRNTALGCLRSKRALRQSNDPFTTHQTIDRAGERSEQTSDERC
jgi:hypothetical protein